MDEPGEWAEPWPYWKFGMKQNDLHDALHVKYNTILTAIQDPEAFHHDVYELSTRADTFSEFEQLMDERKTLRLKELDSMLEDASFQIVGCPKLIGTDQWPLAVQLFRTKSFDSLVRYFASYLPDEHPWHFHADSGINSNGSDAESPVSPVYYPDYDGPTLFDEPEDDEAFYTHDHSESFSTCDTAVDLGDQPARSNTMHSIDSGVSVSDRKRRRRNHDSRRSASRPSSILDAEPDSQLTTNSDSIMTLHDDENALQSEDSDAPFTYFSDLSDDVDRTETKDALMATNVDEEDVDGYLSKSHAQLSSMETMDSDAPTPKAAATRSPATPATPLFEPKLSPLRTRSPSANRSHPHHAHHNHVNHQQHSRSITTARQLRRRDGSLEPEQRPRRMLGGKASRGREVSPYGRARPRAHARRRRPGA